MTPIIPLVDPHNQAYKIARALNSGVLVAEYADPVPSVAIPVVSGIAKMFTRFFGPKPIIAPVTAKIGQRLFLPVGVESTVLFLPVQVLRDDCLRFCPVNEALAGKGFKGSSKKTSLREDTVDVFTTRHIRGIPPEERRKAVIRIQNDGLRTRAVVEDLVPMETVNA